MSGTAHDPWGFEDEAPTTRAPRQLETRQVAERRRVWQPAALLPDPLPQEGWVFRWCRSEVHSQSDHTTFQKRLREGWEPVNGSDHPEMMSQIGRGDLKHSGLVEVGGLVLCKMPEEMSEQRRQYYAQLNRDKTDAAENSYMRDNDERMAKMQQQKRDTVYGSRAR